MSKYLNIIFGVALLVKPIFFYGMEVKPKGFSNKLIEHIQSEDPELLRAFLVYKKRANNLDIQASSDGGQQAIHYAVELGNLEMVKLLIEFGALVNAQAQDERGRRPLHLAASIGNAELFELLVDSGADSSLTDNLDLLPRHHAVNRKIKDLIVALTEASLNENKSSTQKRVDIANQFLTQEINSFPHYSFENTPSSADLSNSVLSQKKDLNSQNSYQPTTLQTARQLRPQGTIFDAIERGNVADVKLFLDYGINIEDYCGNGHTPLICAAEFGDTETVKLFIAHGAKIEAQDRSGNTPLIWAADKGYVDTVKLLIARGANINAQSNSRFTPLILAAANGHIEIVKLLLSHRANAHAKTCYGDTAATKAAQNRHNEIVDLLRKSN